MRSSIRRIAIVGLCIALCTLFSSISYAARPTVIKVAHDLSPDPYDPTHGFATVFKNYVESRTDGKYVVEIYPSSVLGKERERL
ncbi:MAG: ABC transporter substrate-binding protein, partial [Firmicutes bacterium]|nr:ABC transporter substrate-binding protein [Bacillota bacterium]